MGNPPYTVNFPTIRFIEGALITSNKHLEWLINNPLLGVKGNLILCGRWFPPLHMATTMATMGSMFVCSCALMVGSIEKTFVIWTTNHVIFAPCQVRVSRFYQRCNSSSFFSSPPLLVYSYASSSPILISRAPDAVCAGPGPEQRECQKRMPEWMPEKMSE